MKAMLIILIAAIALSVLMMLAFAISDRTGKSGWIDATWTFSVGGVGAIVALLPLAASGPPARRVMVAVLLAVWSLRLGLHIVARTRHGGDDPRYAQLKQDWGAAARTKMFWFLQIQAAVALPLVVAAAVAARNPAPWPDAGDVIGIIVLLVAIGGEAAADRQLKSFAREPANKGKICDTGLWRLTRHPNYFFEWLGWLAYVAIALDVSGRYGWGFVALVGPATMYWLLVYVSGIPPLEAHMLRSRPAAFRAYQARVNAFWPGPPRLK